MLQTISKVEVFYDVVSPYSLLAVTTLHRYSSRRNLNVTYRPFFLGGIMQAAGNTPPAMVPLRGAYMFKDIERNAKYFNIAGLKLPSVFPVNTMQAQRLLTAVTEHAGEDAQVRLALKLWELYWQNGKDISKEEFLRFALTECDITGPDQNIVVALATDDNIKQKLKETTTEASKRGAFGAPTMFVNVNGKEEMFFGSDRFHIMFPMIGMEWEGPDPPAAKL